MVQCPTCRVTYVANTLFCTECGLYLIEDAQPSTEPLEAPPFRWPDERGPCLSGEAWLSQTKTPTLRLRIQKQGRLREWEVNLLKPVRLGRLDPNHDIFPEVDLTEAGGMEHGVSREHACIFERLGEVEVEDLGSTNGTLLNGQRLAPYIPHPMCSGDRLQLGKLELEIIFESG